ncbi:hypothetical protein Tco_0163294 [Tanacetum coccineum]
MYEKIKRSTKDFIAIGSVEDESLIKKMKKKDSSKGEEIKQESKEEVKLRGKGRKRNKKESRTENFGTKPQFDESKRSEEINMNVVTRSNGQKRSFSTLMRVLSVFDREKRLNKQGEFWNSQHEWNIVSWKLHSSLGVHTLMTDEGLVVHMLIEKKYPLKKEIVVQMLSLKLESERKYMALELIRFTRKILADLELKNKTDGRRRGLCVGNHHTQMVVYQFPCLTSIRVG